MDEQRTTGPRDPDTRRPEHPPNSVMSKDTRRKAVWSYFFPLVILCVVMGALVVYWSNRPAHSDAPGTKRPEIGTVGRTDGGFNPEPRPTTTDNEVQSRGGDLTPITSLAELRDRDASRMTGRRVNLDEARVDRVSGSEAWVRDGGQAVAIVMPEGAPTVTAGQKIAVTGRVASANGEIRIVADRLQVR